MTEGDVRTLIADAGGTVTNFHGPLPDGSGFAVGSFPLPKDHWLLAESPEEGNVPPMPLRLGLGDFITVLRHPPALPPHVVFTRAQLAAMLAAAGRYAVRCATMNGKEMDFDPDALIQNLIIGMLGYYTPTGLCSDECDLKDAPPE